MKSITTFLYESELDKVQLPTEVDGKEKGYGWIDLGLPSGKKWAQCNIGADKPEEPGLLFQWGRTDGYKYRKNNFLSKDDYVTTSGTSYKEGDTLKPKDDAAAVNMGGKWHMPTKADIEELLDNTTNSWVTCGGEVGRLFVSKKDENKKLFIPAAGCFNGRWDSFSGADRFGCMWSSSVYSDDADDAYNLGLDSDYCASHHEQRYDGFSVRGVC